MEKYGDPEIGEVAESPSARFDELNLGVETFRYCVRDSMLKEVADIRIVPRKGPGRFNHRLQTAMRSPKIPAPVKTFRRLRMGVGPVSAKLLLHRKGPAYFQGLVFQLPKFPPLATAPILSACQPKVLGTRQRLVSVRFQLPMLLLANLVQCLGQIAHHVKLILDKDRIGQLGLNRIPVRNPHIGRHRFYIGLLLDVQNIKRSLGCSLITTLGDFQNASLQYVHTGW